ncbi:hypothetical protein TorRG33x02_342910, partial [Trema orientale]
MGVRKVGVERPSVGRQGNGGAHVCSVEIEVRGPCSRPSWIIMIWLLSPSLLRDPPPLERGTSSCSQKITRYLEE